MDKKYFLYIKHSKNEWLPADAIFPEFFTRFANMFHSEMEASIAKGKFKNYLKVYAAAYKVPIKIVSSS